MERNYYFAGVPITVRVLDGIPITTNEYLEAFRVDSVEDPYVFEFQRSDVLSEPFGHLVATPPGMRIYKDGERVIRYMGSVQESWDKAYLRIEGLGKKYHAQYLEKFFPDMLMAKTVLGSIGAEHLISCAGGFVFHCSYIEWEGKAILFTAPSGTGKSTQADLWNQFMGAEIINGDRAAVRPLDNVVLAEGIPFAGSSQYCKNRSLPIQAIVYLGQAKMNSIRKLYGYEAFFKIWEGISVNTWISSDIDNVSSAVQKTVSKVPVFHLLCTPDKNAVDILFEALRKLE